MKLIHKTRQTYIITSVIIFIVSSVIIYFTLNKIIKNRQDEKLLWDKELIAKKLKYDYPLPIFDVEDYESTVNIKDTLYFKDTLIYQFIDETEKHELYRQLTSIENLHGKTYKIITRASIVKTQDFILAITLSVGIVLILLITVVFLVNTFFMRNAWLPFYENLEILRNFTVENSKPIRLQNTNIDEFKELNHSLIKLTDKIISDFNNLKEFTENASHEMQTPLAIMMTKSELLMQSDNLKRNQVKQIKSIYLAVQRLSKLNKTLLLLSKIENQQFSETREVLVNEVMEKHLEMFEDFIANKRITINKNFTSDAKVITNPLLFDMVISNLIGNAIKHNFKQGNIDITTSELFISISNSGDPLSIPSSSLFERFKKESKSSDSFGLGLAIVKKICDTNHWKINHSYIEDQHNISIYF